MSEGALAFDTTIGALKIYTSSAWTVLPFDWDGMWRGGDPVHTHASDAEGGNLTWSSVWGANNPIHNHKSDAAGGTLGSVLGTWNAGSNNTVYQATTDGFVLCRGTTDVTVIGYTDGSNPPTTERIRQESSQNSINSFTMPVRKNDYWKVTGGAVIYWIPLGD